MHQALTVFGSSMTCTLQSHLRGLGTHLHGLGDQPLRDDLDTPQQPRIGDELALACWYLPISCTYAWRDALMACCSETSISCVRPVGLVAQAATAAANSSCER